MPKFDKRFIHCVWDESLKEKRCFLADNVVELQERVESNATKFLYTVVRQHHGAYPFQVDYDLVFPFCYYDPYYTLKLSHEQGKVIQHFKTCAKVWVDVTSELGWTDNPENYRIKPKEELVTNRELAQWLAEGYGQYRNSQIGKAKYHFEYVALEDDMPIHEDIRVRVWGDTEWHEPTREYMGLS